MKAVFSVSKLFLLLFVSISLFLISCGRRSEEHESGTVRSNGSNTAKSSVCFFEDAENGFYLVSFNDPEYLYYYDVSTKTAVKLCGKANCRHNSGSCNARYGDGSNGINMYNLQIYKGRLYLWDSSSTGGPHLYSADQDGKNHQDLGELKIDMARGQGGIERSFIFDDTLYAIAIVGTNDLGYQYMRIYKRSLEAGAEAQLIFADEDEKTTEHRMSQLIAEGGQIYFEDVAFFDGLNRLESRLYRYDPEKAEVKNILTLENKRIIYTVKDQKIYYSAFDYISQSYEDVVCYDPEEDRSTSFCKIGGMITWDGQYFIVEKYDFDERLSEKYHTAMSSVSAIAFVKENGEVEKMISADQLLDDTSESNICLSGKYIITDTYLTVQENKLAIQELRIYKKDDLIKDAIDYSILRFEGGW